MPLGCPRGEANGRPTPGPDAAPPVEFRSAQRRLLPPRSCLADLALMFHMKHSPLTDGGREPRRLSPDLARERPSEEGSGPENALAKAREIFAFDPRHGQGRHFSILRWPSNAPRRANPHPARLFGPCAPSSISVKSGRMSPFGPPLPRSACLSRPCRDQAPFEADSFITRMLFRCPSPTDSVARPSRSMIAMWAMRRS